LTFCVLPSYPSVVLRRITRYSPSPRYDTMSKDYVLSVHLLYILYSWQWVYPIWKINVFHRGRVADNYCAPCFLLYPSRVHAIVTTSVHSVSVPTSSPVPTCRGRFFLWQLRPCFHFWPRFSFIKEMCHPYQHIYCTYASYET